LRRFPKICLIFKAKSWTPTPIMKIFKLTLIFAAVLSTNAFAQQESVDTAAFRQIRNAEMSNSHIPWIAHNITDVSGPRLTNSPGFFRAANWAIETMKKWGMANAALEAWGDYGKGYETTEFSISMSAPYKQMMTGYAIPYSASTNGEIHGQVYQTGFFSLFDPTFVEKHKAELSGKIVMVSNSQSKRKSDFNAYATRFADTALANMKDLYMVSRKEIEMDTKYLTILSEAMDKLKAAGALAVVFIDNSNRDGTVAVQAFGGQKATDHENLPQAEICAEDGLKISRLIASGHQVELTMNLKGKFYTDDLKGHNVIAEIPGTDPKLKAQVVMLGGHLDSWNAGTGATDNGAGCIVMMEAVRLLDSLHLRPKRTIRIALWDGEEQGLFGSYNYVKNHFGNAETGIFKPEQAKVSAYFNLDNGTGKIRGIFAQGNTAVKPIFEQWFKPFADLDAKTVTLANTGSTDHQSFDWVGIPGFQFIQDPLDYEEKTHHTNMDTYDFLQIDDLKQAAIIVASFVYQAANRPDLLPRKPVVKEKFVFDGL